MKLLDKIIETENLFLNEALLLQKLCVPIYIYGSGGWGRKVALCLDNANVRYEGFVVNQKYITNEKEEKSIEELFSQVEKKVGIIIAFRGYSPELLSPYQDKIFKIINRDAYAGIAKVGDSGFFSYEWVVSNEVQLQKLYDMLEDELSKETLAAYINQKISTDYKYLAQVKRSNQYFEDDLINLSGDERFVDCGAYAGDTAIAFIAALERRGYASYREIISFEPDRYNYEQLQSRMLERHTCICAGVSDVSGGVAHFSRNNASSRVQADGEETIELESIDHYLAGTEASFIKMDIEGMELPALKGAEETIKKWHPKLAICVYHKREDLLTIPQYISELVPSYNFYIRAYDNTAIELVLYAL